MKTNRTTSKEEPVSRLLYREIGSRARNAVNKLHSISVETAGQLAGKLQSRFPKLTNSEARIRCVAPSFLEVQKRRRSDDALKRMQRFLELSNRDIAMISNVCKEIPTDHQLYCLDSSYAFGTIKQGRTKSAHRPVHFRKNRLATGFYVIPRYQDAGPIFDQGNRGTCVSNAVCTLLNYKTNGAFSRQMLNHQCKMVDGMKNLEGTTIEAPFNVMSHRPLIDIGNVPESIWRYNPHPGKTVHQGPPPDQAYYTRRIIAASLPAVIGQNNKVQDIKNLLNLGLNGKTCPVVIGIPLYESFFSWSVHESGWVTLPIPGEAIVGYHAMIIVGYDDDRKLFLVRNSWGPQWANQNDRGYNGHAWIPYDYIRRFCFSGATITELTMKTISIPEHERLNYRKTSGSRKDRAAAFSKKGEIAHQGRGGRISFMGFLIRIAAVILILMAYREPILKFKDKVITYIENNVDLSEVRESAKEAIKKLNP